MFLSALNFQNVRNIAQARIAPADGINWMYGLNGAGKTSVLEAIYLLARGQSFRTGQLTAVISDRAEYVRIFARTQDPAARLGVERAGNEWRGRIDGDRASRISEFARRMPLVLIDPENHLLLEGGPALRRSFIDWGLFHVEQSYLAQWRDYSRLLRQRNAALRHRVSEAVLDAIERPMSKTAEVVERQRKAYCLLLAENLPILERELDFRLPGLRVEYRPSAENAEGYLEIWRQARLRDREQGFTREGPQRGDLIVRSEHGKVAERFSRGQMKLGALLLKLAQAACGPEASAPVLLIDDPVSELDSDHLERLLGWLVDQPLQSWLTSVEAPPRVKAALFHVEQGKIQPVV